MSPPPWRLRGQALVAVYGRPDPGALLLLRYAASPVGPYDEVMWVTLGAPSPAGPRPQVTRIAVSTPQSVTWGRANWGIPKTLARFEWQGTPERGQVRVWEDGQLLTHLAFQQFGPALPVSTGLVPAPRRTLAQPRLDGQAGWWLTQVNMTGRVRPARLSVIQGAALHPALETGRPLLTVALPTTHLLFPVPTPA
ncbi:hypothetical protein GO986_13905 [Deinococcus sp. HMF7620]|uniref:Acetoacetate decarboxylase n=1 Tax=Deinococcus arboris TaxID=2682977 RepID=A0A7C9I411_9DEIO|nr:hypothetical protein [Deinococcus arboris]MVN87851.1 hypothetical protein [Deinococcus arboris]